MYQYSYFITVDINDFNVYFVNTFVRYTAYSYVNDGWL